MSTQEETVRADLDFASDRLSTQTRQIALGIIAVVWALLIGEIDSALKGTPRLLLLLAALAVVALFLDFCQYLAAYSASLRAKRDLKDNGTGRYQETWLSYRLRFWFFRGKIAVCLFVTILFLGAIIWSLL